MINVVNIYGYNNFVTIIIIYVNMPWNARRISVSWGSFTNMDKVME